VNPGAALWSASQNEYAGACSVEGIGVTAMPRDGEGPVDIEASVTDVVRDSMEDLTWTSCGSFESTGRIVLFDAASQACELSDEECLEFAWPQGAGMVHVAEISADDSAARIVGFRLSGDR
jgi:hypothetical protein